MSVATSNMKLIGAFLIKLYSAQPFSSYFHIGFFNSRSSMAVLIINLIRAFVSQFT